MKMRRCRLKVSSLERDRNVTFFRSPHCDVKPGTAVVYGHSQRNLIAYFGMDKPLRDITPGDGDKWRLYLIGEGLSDNTVRRRCGIAKHFLRAALRSHLVLSNPFDDLETVNRSNPAKVFFITREDAQKVIDACPTTEWKLLFVLARYGGLRCPSEHLLLRWEDIDWQAEKMFVRSPKAEHHPGGESRFVPIFQEVKKYLLEALEQRKEGEAFVITRTRRPQRTFAPIWRGSS